MAHEKGRGLTFFVTGGTSVWEGYSSYVRCLDRGKREEGKGEREGQDGTGRGVASETPQTSWVSGGGGGKGRVRPGSTRSSRTSLSTIKEEERKATVGFSLFLTFTL